MNLLRSPKNKLIAAAALLVCLSLATTSLELSPSSLARAVLALAALAGMGVWFWRVRGVPGRTRFQLKTRLEVVSRTGLSQRAGVALVEVDGKPFLIVHGDGYAEVHPASAAPAPVPVKRPINTDRYPALSRRPASRRHLPRSDCQ